MFLLNKKNFKFFVIFLYLVSFLILNLYHPVAAQTVVGHSAVSNFPSNISKDFSIYDNTNVSPNKECVFGGETTTEFNFLWLSPSDKPTTDINNGTVNLTRGDNYSFRLNLGTVFCFATDAKKGSEITYPKSTAINTNTDNIDPYSQPLANVSTGPNPTTKTTFNVTKVQVSAGSVSGLPATTLDYGTDTSNDIIPHSIYYDGSGSMTFHSSGVSSKVNSVTVTVYFHPYNFFYNLKNYQCIGGSCTLTDQFTINFSNSSPPGGPIGDSNGNGNFSDFTCNNNGSTQSPNALFEYTTPFYAPYSSNSSTQTNSYTYSNFNFNFNFTEYTPGGQPISGDESYFFPSLNSSQIIYLSMPSNFNNNATPGQYSYSVTVSYSYDQNDNYSNYGVVSTYQTPIYDYHHPIYNSQHQIIGYKFIGYTTNYVDGWVSRSSSTPENGPSQYFSSDGSGPNCDYRPFFQIYSGDVVAGSNICNKPNTTNNNSSIKSFIDDNYESSSDFAAIATGTIKNLVSGQSLLGGNSLDFANTPSNGSFGTSPCIPNYFNPPSQSDILTSVNINSPLQINSGQHRTYFVHGSVYINSNITLNPSNNKPADLPSFNLIVEGGNIHIGPNVTQLDGLYEALGTGSQGNIYDCSSGSGPGYYANQCSNPLQVNGTMIAQNQIHLDRTYSGLIVPPYPGIPGSPAETFNLSPINWFDNIDNNSSSSSHYFDPNPNTQYASLTSLPPIY